MCGCTPTVSTSTSSSKASVGPCGSVTADILATYIQVIKCVLDKSAYAQVSSNETECLAVYDTLNAWKELKEQDPLDCTYLHYMPIVQDLVKRIILSGVCK